jgi:hypothetical protein
VGLEAATALTPTTSLTDSHGDRLMLHLSSSLAATVGEGKGEIASLIWFGVEEGKTTSLCVVQKDDAWQAERIRFVRGA